jgi:hypothetical protein
MRSIQAKAPARGPFSFPASSGDPMPFDPSSDDVAWSNAPPLRITVHPLSPLYPSSDPPLVPGASYDGWSSWLGPFAGPSSASASWPAISGVPPFLNGPATWPPATTANFDASNFGFAIPSALPDPFNNSSVPPFSFQSFTGSAPVAPATPPTGADLQDAIAAVAQRGLFGGLADMASPPAPPPQPMPSAGPAAPTAPSYADLQHAIAQVVQRGLLGRLAEIVTPQSSAAEVQAATRLVAQRGLFGKLADLVPTSAAPGGSSGGGIATAPGTPAQPAMPDPFEAFLQGILAGSRQLKQSVQSLTGSPISTTQPSPAAAPLGWSDVEHPSVIAAKIAYQFAQSYPTLAGGIVGGALGSLVGPEGTAVGAIAGGSLGAAALSAAQTLGPVFATELQRTPNDPNGAWERAWRQAEVSGLFSGASWGLYPLRFFKGSLQHLVFQALGVQPALSVGERVASNLASGRPATEGIGQAYGQGVLGTAIPALGHGVVNWFLPARTLPRPHGDQRSKSQGQSPYKEGSFSFSRWTGYPDNIPKPKGPFRLTRGAEYEEGRAAANKANKKTHDSDPMRYRGKHIHEIHPVKFGGDPVDQANKIALTPEQHYLVNSWWYRIQRELER